MTDRLADITAHIAGVHQLGAVVNAMRGIAASRVQQARLQLEAVDRYAGTIASAIGRVLALLPDPVPAPTKGQGRLALVLFCAEQGFAGAFSERVLEAAGPELARAEVFLIGTRGAVIAAERAVPIAWRHAMPSHSPGIPNLADAIVEAIYAGIAAGKIGRLDALFSGTGPDHRSQIERRHLIPFDLRRFPKPTGTPPLINLPQAELLRALTAEYLHAQLCDAALHAFAAENQARMEAMAAARGQIEDQLAILQARQRTVRQDEITEEIIELAAGETASRPGQA